MAFRQQDGPGGHASGPERNPAGMGRRRVHIVTAVPSSNTYEFGQRDALTIVQVTAREDLLLIRKTFPRLIDGWMELQ